MMRLRVFLSRVLGHLIGRRRDADLAEEIRDHLDRLAEEHLRRGLSEAAARVAARREFGSVLRTLEAHRSQRRFAIVDALLQDVRFALRQLRRSPAFAIGAMMSLAIGIGFTVAMFTAIDALLLHPYPYPDAERMTRPTVYDKSGSANQLYLTGPQITRLRQMDVIDDVIAVDAFPMTITGTGLPDYVLPEHVSANAFDYWGIPPLFGRTFSDASPWTTRVADRVVVLTYTYWRAHYGEDRRVIGRVLRLDHQPYEIVGVMPRDFRSNYYGAQIFVPAEHLADSNSPIAVEIKLKPGISRQAGGAALAPLFTQFAAESPRQIPHESRVELLGLNDVEQRRFGATLAMLFGAASLLLIVGCVNAAILLLARGTAREQELAVRRALGAAPVRLVMQLLIEVGCIACGGTLAGALVAQESVRMIRAASPLTYFPPEREFRATVTVIAFAVIAASRRRYRPVCGRPFATREALGARFGRFIDSHPPIRLNAGARTTC